MTDRPNEPIEPGWLIANESEAVQVRRVDVGNGTRLELSSERTGTSTRLDAVALASLTRLTPEIVEQLVRAATEGIDD